MCSLIFIVPHRRTPRSSPFPYTTLFRSGPAPMLLGFFLNAAIDQNCEKYIVEHGLENEIGNKIKSIFKKKGAKIPEYQGKLPQRSEEHTSELQSRENLVCRLLLEKKKST